MTDADGRYRLSGLKAGESYQIEVKPPFTAADPAWQHQMPWIPKLPDHAEGEVALPDLNLRKLNQYFGRKGGRPRRQFGRGGAGERHVARRSYIALSHVDGRSSTLD